MNTIQQHVRCTAEIIFDAVSRCIESILGQVAVFLAELTCWEFCYQDAFEDLDKVFLEELTEEQEELLKKYLKRLKANKLDLFIEQLHDCLVLRIAVPQDRSAEDFMDVEQTK